MNDIIIKILLWLVNTVYNLTFPLIIAFAIQEVVTYRRFHYLVKDQEEFQDLFAYFETATWIFTVIGVIYLFVDIVYMTGVKLGTTIDRFVTSIADEHHLTICSYIKYGYAEHPFKTTVYLIYIAIIMTITVWLELTWIKANIDKEKDPYGKYS